MESSEDAPPAPPCVSVVMIFLDPPLDFFAEAVRSVLDQSLPGVELLLCDDGSAAPATGLARGWAEDHPGNVRYLEHPGHRNRGMSATRNLGLAEVRAEVVAFLDADDVWLPGHLQHEFDLLTAHPEADFVCGRALLWYSWRFAGHVDVWTPLAWPAGSVVRAPGMVEVVLARGIFTTPMCSLLVRTAALRAVGGFVDEFTGMLEDQVLLTKLYLSRTCVVSGARTARYRRHDGSATAQSVQSGRWHPSALNDSDRTYLRWLIDQPQLTRTEPPWPRLRARAETMLGRYRRRLPLWSQPELLRDRVPQPLRHLARRTRRLRGRTLDRRPWLGTLRRTTPLDPGGGIARGTPVDEFYAARFFAEHQHLIRGRVREIGLGRLSGRFGPTDGDGTAAASATESGTASGAADLNCLLVADLGAGIDLGLAVPGWFERLRPGGTLLCAVAGIRPLGPDPKSDPSAGSPSPNAVFGAVAAVFGADAVDLRTRGNVLTAVARLTGLAAEELSRRELDYDDPRFPVLTTIRADRPFGF